MGRYRQEAFRCGGGRRWIPLRLVLISGAVSMLAGLAACGTRLSPEEKALLDDARVRAERLSLDTPYVTVAGPGLDSWRRERGVVEQEHVPPEIATRHYTTEADRLAIHLPGRAVRDSVSIDLSSVDEGRLFRIHVACATPDSLSDRTPTACDRFVVLGMYDQLWSKAAVEDQAYECVECDNGDIICGSTPKCRR